MMNGVRLPDNQTPTVRGQYAFMVYADRQIHHPDEIGDGEWWVCDPNSNLYRLIQPIHSWVVHEDGTVTITPSIVAPRGGFHGFLRRGVWS
jgi:hypothetical protein